MTRTVLERSGPIAILPAAGRGTRLGLLDTSKELVPVGISGQWPKGRPVIDHLLERLGAGGVRQARVITVAEKPDIQRTLGDCCHNVQLEYLTTPRTPSSVHTLCVALHQAEASQQFSQQFSQQTPQKWVLGFPDILFEPKTAYRSILQRLEPGVDLVLGLFPSDRPEKTDMVELDPQGRVVDLRIKQPPSGLRYTWSIACWSERFTKLLLQAANPVSPTTPPPNPTRSCPSRELFVGHVVQAALALGLEVVAETFPEGWALDVGTVEDLERARSRET